VRLLILLVLTIGCAVQAKDVTVESVSFLAAPGELGTDFAIGPRFLFPSAEIDDTAQAATSVLFEVTGPTGITKDCLDTTPTFVSGTRNSWSCEIAYP